MKKLKKWIENNELSQNEIARRLGVTPSAFSLYVNSKRKMPLELAIKIQKVSEGEIKCEDLV